MQSTETRSAVIQLSAIQLNAQVSKKQIARAMMEGLFLNPSAQFAHSPYLDFAYDEDVFRAAYDEFFAPAGGSS